MANYCVTKLVFEGDKVELDDFEAILRRLEAMKEEDFPVNNVSWGSKWLGFIVNEFGEDYRDFNCKGCWYDLERRGDTVLALTTESAWSKCDDVLSLVTDKWPSLNYFYYAEEPNSDYFETNDAEGKYFPQRFFMIGTVPVKDENDQMSFVDFDEYLNTEQDVLDFVGHKLHHPIESIDDITKWNDDLEALNEEHEDDEDWEECYIYVNKIDEADNESYFSFDDIEPVVD